MEQDQQHFNKLFWFCVGCAGLGIIFLITLCFVPVPKGSERFADNCQGFFQGSIVTAAMSFLLGGNIPLKKSSDVKVPGNIPTVPASTQSNNYTTI